MGGGAQELTGPDLEQGIAFGDLTPGKPCLGHAAGEAVVVVRVGDDVHAIGASCSHYGGPLAEGRVVIGAHIDYTGFVCHAAIIRPSGSAAIDQAALASLVTWRFQPAVLQNQAVDSLFHMTLDFSFADRRVP